MVLYKRPGPVSVSASGAASGSNGAGSNMNMGIGQRIERSLGSTYFGILIGCFGILSQVVFTLGVGLVYFLAGSSSSEGAGSTSEGGSQSEGEDGSQNVNTNANANAARNMLLMIHNRGGGGLWILIFGLTALECAYEYRHSGPNSRRRLFLTEVPTLYYPLILLFLYTLFGLGGRATATATASGSFTIAIFILAHLPEITSVGIGYALGLGKVSLDQILSIERRKRMEEVGFVRPLTTRAGFVVSPPSGSASSSDLTLIPMMSSSSSASYGNVTSSGVSRFSSHNRSVSADEEQVRVRIFFFSFFFLPKYCNIQFLMSDQFIYSYFISSISLYCYRLSLHYKYK